ncbi:rod shape-determining protein RodA [Candidatus Kuenenbacteria bacterium HGW-Kuenenbacteria-1]|uniref:Rod shape-determining protein RodA n=1 Tax=Candidatus Kuenenbacteria bacterium HGW-Kuenenbacteria-1 TaxID=2013812 RepID=A0A2N1UNG0_9BACT|nr:MAG: rod shape-determining protein RodA [Candidatus Kuenenbacteria bacterium HGW-Kuenenbacteria-1]
MKFIQNLKQFDWIMIGAVFFLTVFGLIIQYSLSLNQEVISFSNFNKQLIFAIIGIILMFLISFLNFNSLKNYAIFLYIFILILLISVLFFGKTFRGTQGWINLPFGINFQIAELTKIILVIVLAKYWSNNIYNIQSFKHIILTGIITIIPFILIALQPDLGSALIFFGLWLGIIFIISKPKILIKILILFVLIFGISWFGLKDYQKDRIIIFVNPQVDPLGRGYQIIQSTIAIGSGQFWGRGLGLGPQSQLKFLPEARTDFVFAVIAEELGMIGSFLILGLFGILFYRFWEAIKKIKDDFNIFLILGFALVFFIEIFINIGMNIGIAPITGISLPFLSYGGSSLLTNLFIIGIIQSVIRKT